MKKLVVYKKNLLQSFHDFGKLYFMLNINIQKGCVNLVTILKIGTGTSHVKEVYNVHIQRMIMFFLLLTKRQSNACLPLPPYN